MGANPMSVALQKAIATLSQRGHTALQQKARKTAASSPLRVFVASATGAAALRVALRRSLKGEGAQRHAFGTPRATRHVPAAPDGLNSSGSVKDGQEGDEEAQAQEAGSSPLAGSAKLEGRGAEAQPCAATAGARAHPNDGAKAGGQGCKAAPTAKAPSGGPNTWFGCAS
jgi:hypothetical protein